MLVVDRGGLRCPDRSAGERVEVRAGEACGDGACRDARAGGDPIWVSTLLTTQLQDLAFNPLLWVSNYAKACSDPANS